MEKSTEIRWFFKGQIPGPVKDWFCKKSRLGEALTAKDKDEREDLYLLAEENINVSPKLREGKLEIKIRAETDMLTDPTVNSTGLIERWSKWEWRYTKSDKEKDRDELEINDRVIAGFVKNSSKDKCVNVGKVRWQRTFQFDNTGDIKPVSEGRIDEGFKGEVTQLKVKSEDWWTMAFEILENPKKPMADRIQKLKQSIAWFFKGKAYEGPPLESNRSYSYPQWIQNL